MDLLDGFAWPVPRAFAAAVSVCRFEQGDVLYDSAVAYQAASGSGSPGLSVQVLDPPRSARSAPADAEGSRFLANWESPVSFELHDFERDSTEIAESTQGRLFTCLWRGDRGSLAAAPEALPLPRNARELQAHLEAAVPALERQARAAGAPAGGLLFVTVLDQSSEASLAKARLVVSRLSTRFGCRAVDLSPAAAAVPDGDAFHPALRIRGCAIESADEAAVRAVLKTALYAPTRALAPGEEQADRFKLERHGHLGVS